MRGLSALFLSCIFAWSIPRPSAAQDRPTRLALVVGVGDYKEWDSLPNATRDAKLVADTLSQRLQFTLVDGRPLLNPDKKSLEAAIRHFGDQLGPGTVAIFYYAGHGTRHNTQTYLVPINAGKPDTPEAYDEQLVGVDDRVLYQMQERRASGLNIIVVDACRDELPMSDTPKSVANRTAGSNSLLASRGGGPVRNSPAPDMPGPDLSGGTIVVYSTEVDGVAMDGLRGPHSPFATAFVDTIPTPGLEIREVFNEIGAKVQNISSANAVRQIPWISQSPIKQSFYLGGPPSTDPRKELAAMRYDWDIVAFFDAIERRDYKAVELFLKAGMKMNHAAPGETDFKIFLQGNYFDPQIASLIVYYNAVDPEKACPVPPNSRYASSKFYTEFPLRPEVVPFIREVCQRDSVMQRFDKNLRQLAVDAEQEKARHRQAEEARRRDAGRPLTDREILMQRLSRNQMERYKAELGPGMDSYQDQLVGWREARTILWGSPSPTSPAK